MHKMNFFLIDRNKNYIHFMACNKLTASRSISVITLFPLKVEVLLRSLNLILSFPFRKSTCVGLENLCWRKAMFSINLFFRKSKV